MTNAIIEAQGGTVEKFEDEVINIDEEMNKEEKQAEEKKPVRKNRRPAKPQNAEKAE